MKSIHVLRKPCSEPTVAANVLRHGTGAVNVNATRIAHSDPSDLDAHRKMVEAIKSRGGRMAHIWKNSSDLSGASDVSTGGRWPANLVLQHLDGCRQDGVRKMPGHKGYPNGPGGSSMQYTSSRRGTEVRPSAWKGHADPDGTETVVAWACVEGCPVAALDVQSGISQSASGVVKYVRAETSGWKERGGSFTPGHTWEAAAYGDKGGASRYFKQVKS